MLKRYNLALPCLSQRIGIGKKYIFKKLVFCFAFLKVIIIYPDIVSSSSIGNSSSNCINNTSKLRMRNRTLIKFYYFHLANSNKVLIFTA